MKVFCVIRTMRYRSLILFVSMSILSFGRAPFCSAQTLAEQKGFGLDVKVSAVGKGFELSLQPESSKYSFTAEDVTIYSLDHPSRLIVILPYQGEILPEPVGIGHSVLSQLRFVKNRDKMRVVIDAAAPVLFQF